VDTEVTAIPVCFCPERDYGNVCPACPVVSWLIYSSRVL
jgi:hypothetical protein